MKYFRTVKGKESSCHVGTNSQSLCACERGFFSKEIAQTTVLGSLYDDNWNGRIITFFNKVIEQQLNDVRMFSQPKICEDE
jgi:hypothetical protein